jgi:hypothetical protein
LTPAQVETARRSYAGLKDPTGRQVYPGLMPLSRSVFGAVAALLIGVGIVA